MFSNVVNHPGVFPGIRKPILREMWFYASNVVLSNEVSCSRNIICLEHIWHLKVG